jgi:hypothetical protein
VTPSVKVTVPVGVPAVAATVAVKITAWLNLDGVKLVLTTVVLVDLLTVCEYADESLAVKVVSPA